MNKYKWFDANDTSNTPETNELLYVLHNDGEVWDAEWDNDIDGFRIDAGQYYWAKRIDGFQKWNLCLEEWSGQTIIGWCYKNDLKYFYEELLKTIMLDKKPDNNFMFEDIILKTQAAMTEHKKEKSDEK